MYKIRADEDWSFLAGKELNQLCIGLYDVQLHFNDVSVSINVDELAHSFKHKTSTPSSSAMGGMPGGAVTLVSLLGAKVQRVITENSVTLAIYFSNEEELRIYDSSEAHESFTVSGPNGLIIV